MLPRGALETARSRLCFPQVGWMFTPRIDYTCRAKSVAFAEHSDTGRAAIHQARIRARLRWDRGPVRRKSETVMWARRSTAHPNASLAVAGRHQS